MPLIFNLGAQELVILAFLGAIVVVVVTAVIIAVNRRDKDEGGD
jgi:hypothetical protein